ncbi:FUSC family protein [Siphonobacter sp.]|uniref:FUSC family protein n=1 Tax=Siphonobacter sp. TaxID=1869184 RepID=UPI003B3BB471
MSTPSQPKQNLLKKITHQDVESAALPTLGVFVGLLLAQIPFFGPFAGFIVMVMQCLMNVRPKGTYKERLQILSYVLLILLGTTLWGIIGTYHWVNVVLGVILLSVALSYWRHFFPDDWRSINAPAAALYFFSLAVKADEIAIAAVLISGVLAILLQALMWRVWPAAFESRSPLMRLRSRRARKRTRKLDLSLASLKPDLWRYTFRLAFLLVLSVWLISYTRSFHAYWIPLTIVIVLQDNHSDTLKRVGGRILGTFIGSIIGSFILVLHPEPVLGMPLLILCMFTFLLIVKHNYPVACIFLTIYIILLIGQQTTHSFTVAIERSLFTLVGGFLVFISSFILFWNRKQMQSS